MERLKQYETVFRALFTCSIRPSARSARLGEPREITLRRVLQRSVRRGNDPAKIQAFGGVGASGAARPAPARRLGRRASCDRRRPIVIRQAVRQAVEQAPARRGGGVSLAGSGAAGAAPRGRGGRAPTRRGPGPARDGPPEKIRRTLNFAIDSPGRLRYKPRHTGRASPLARDDDQSVGRAATQTRRLVILKRWAHSSVGRAADS